MSITTNCSYNSHLIDFSYTKGTDNVYNTMQFHSYYELYFFKNGNVEYICNHFRKVLSPNQLIIIPPGEYHNLHVLDNEDIYERCVLNIHPGFIENKILEENLKEKFFLAFSDSDRITEHFRYLVECYNQYSEQDYRVILSTIATDIIYLIKYSEKCQIKNCFDHDTLPEQLMKYIDQNITDDIKLNILANKFNYSISHICHVFKECYGISIKKYILQKRLSCIHSEILLGGKIQYISRAYGFKDYPAFFRLYKKEFGVPPSKHKH